MLPGIDISFVNGSLGGVVQSSDGIFGLIVNADEVATTFEHNKVYSVRNRQQFAALGVTDTVGNHRLFKFVDEFFNEAGEGNQLWIMPVAKTVKVSDMFTPDAGTGKAPADKILDTSNGSITGLFPIFNPEGSYSPNIVNGMDSDVMLAAQKAQIFSENYTERKYAPFFTILEGYAFSGTHTDLPDLKTFGYNRVGIVIGDTESRTGSSTSNGAATGLLAGRATGNQVHEKIGKVRDGALAATEMYIVDSEIQDYDIESLHNKGYIAYRTHTSKSGFYFVDDHLATSDTDDYAFLVRRRVIDKAYRIAYSVLLDFIQDDFDTNSDGSLMNHEAKTIEGRVKQAIFLQMTSNGELSFDQQDKNDKGVVCKVDLSHNVTSTSRIKLEGLQIKPKGYGSYIDVPLGYVPITIN